MEGAKVPDFRGTDDLQAVVVEDAIEYGVDFVEFVDLQI